MFQYVVSPAAGRQFKIVLFASLRVFKTFLPTLESKMLVKICLIRSFLFRTKNPKIVTSGTFHRHNNEKYGTAMMKQTKAASVLGSGSLLTFVLIAKCLLL